METEISKLIYKKTSEKSKEYQLQNDVNLSMFSEGDFFGDNILSELARIKHSAKNSRHSGMHLPIRLDNLEDMISESRWQLQALYSNPDSKKYVESFYQHSARGVIKDLPLISKSLSQSDRIGGLILEILSVTEPVSVERLFNPDQIGDKDYIRILKHHRDRFIKKVNIFEEKKPHYMRTFFNRLHDASFIPDYVGQLAEVRLRNTSITLVDALNAKLDEKFGSFSINQNKLVIAEQVPEELEEHVFTHEALHAISGRTILEKSYFLSDQENEENEIYSHGDIMHQRVGLKMFDEERFFNSFHWLNEAVTEQLTLDLLNKNDSWAYKRERELLTLLRENGAATIPLDLFVKAYFENFDPSKPPGERIPEWKKLYRSINEAYAPGFLTKLDAFIKGNGLKETIELLKVNWQAIHDAPRLLR